MSTITLRVVAKVDARNFKNVSAMPALKDAVIGITYDLDFGNGVTATCESEEGLLDLLRTMRTDFQANPGADK